VYAYERALVKNSLNFSGFNTYNPVVLLGVNKSFSVAYPPVTVLNSLTKFYISATEEAPEIIKLTPV
jgi:hypothetical protein